MRDDKPGDLGIQIGFARVFGDGSDQGKLKPSLQITDGTSGRNLEIELEPEHIAELMSGSEVRVTGDKVTGFRSLRDFGKYHKMVSVHVPTQKGDYRVEGRAVRALPYIAKAIADIEADGYRCDTPRRNNASQWVIVGRRYDDQP